MKKEETKSKFITIHSEITIMVTPGLQHKDVTNPDSRLENKLRINPNWQNAGILILKGKGVYPAEIAEWPTVKALVANEKFTINKDTKLENVSDEKQVAKAKEDKKTIEKAEFLNLNEVADKGE